jgi:hypothetical protein
MQLEDRISVNVPGPQPLFLKDCRGLRVQGLGAHVLA